MTNKNRSTDTENTIRVTITLRRESNPEWYYRLKNIQDGRARAEILRRHLNPPGEVMILRGASAPQQIDSPVELKITPQAESAAKHESVEQLSSMKSTGYAPNETVHYKTQKEINTNETVHYKKEKEINSFQPPVIAPNAPSKGNGVPTPELATTTGNANGQGAFDMLIGRFGMGGQFPTS